MSVSIPAEQAAAAFERMAKRIRALPSEEFIGAVVLVDRDGTLVDQSSFSAAPDLGAFYALAVTAVQNSSREFEARERQKTGLYVAQPR